MLRCEKCGYPVLTLVQRGIMKELQANPETEYNGIQLARALSVTPAAISKAGKVLLSADLIAVRPIPEAMNVKLYKAKGVGRIDFPIRKTAEMRATK